MCVRRFIAREYHACMHGIEPYITQPNPKVSTDSCYCYFCVISTEYYVMIIGTRTVDELRERRCEKNITARLTFVIINSSDCNHRLFFLVVVMLTSWLLLFRSSVLSLGCGIFTLGNIRLILFRGINK